MWAPWRKLKNIIILPFTKARVLSAVLGSVPSMIWVLLYLLLIPSFAALYTFLPSKSFYHSTITHDAIYKEDQEFFRDKLESWINAEITSRLSEAIESVESKKPQKINYYAGYSPNDIWPEVLITANFEDRPQLSMTFTLASMAHLIVRENKDYTPPKVSTESSEGFNLKGKCEKREEICKAKLVEQKLKPDYYFAAPADIYYSMYKLKTEGNGFNYGSDFHTFGRMFYLSAMTATTVGYGDIVPLTAFTRFAVSCEAIFGIVLIGLFLNALAHEIQSQNVLTKDK